MVKLSLNQIKNNDSILTDKRNCNSDKDICSICLRTKKNKATITDCKHSFCFNCIKEWSKKRLQCPLCKAHFINVVIQKRIYQESSEIMRKKISKSNKEDLSLNNLQIGVENKSILRDIVKSDKKFPKFKVVKELIRLDIIMKQTQNQQNTDSSSIQQQSSVVTQILPIIYNSEIEPQNQQQNQPSDLNLNIQQNLESFQNTILLEYDQAQQRLFQLENQQTPFSSQNFHFNCLPEMLDALLRKNKDENLNRATNFSQVMLNHYLSNAKCTLLRYLYQNLFNSDNASTNQNQQNNPIENSIDLQQINGKEDGQTAPQQSSNQQIQLWLQQNQNLTNSLLQQTLNQIIFTDKFFNIQDPLNQFDSDQSQ